MSQLTNFGSGGGGGSVDSVTGGNNITITGTATNPIVNVSGTTNHTLQLGNATGSLTSLAVATDGQIPIGSTGASPVLGNITGGPGITISNGPGTIMIESDAGTVTSVSGGNNITITGTAADPIVNVSGASENQVLIGAASGALNSLPAATDGQILTGVTGSAPVWVDPTGASITITGDAGTPATSDSFTITGGTSGAVFTVDGTDTITESFDFLSLPTTTSTDGQIRINGNSVLHAYGSGGIFSGNIFVGNSAGNYSTTGGNNVALGGPNLANLTNGSDNTSIGASSLTLGSSGFGNVAVGTFSLQSVDTGSYNVAIGYSAGNNYNGDENFNILIGSNELGEAGESNVIKIGTAVAETCFIGGIDGVDVGSVATVVTESGDQLGTAVLTAGTGISITPTANTITIAATGASIGTIDGDTGSASGSTVNLVGGSSGAVFTGDNVSTVTASFNYLALPTTDSTNGQITINGLPTLHSFGGLTNLYLGGAGNFTASSPNDNFGAGYLALNSVAGGSNNIAIGASSLQSLDSGQGNVVVGNSGSGGLITSGELNTILGYFAGGSLIDGDQNIIIGESAGANLASSESGNIIIGTGGVVGDNTTTRIGDPGTITTCFVAGITGVTVSNTNFVTIDSTTGQLGATPSASAPWTTVSFIPMQQMDVNNNYIANNSGIVSFTLPATSPVGSMIKVTGKNNTGGWSIVQNAGNTIYYGTQFTTTGTGGSLSSSHTRDSVELVCVTADADWNVLSSVGTLTVV